MIVRGELPVAFSLPPPQVLLICEMLVLCQWCIGDFFFFPLRFGPWVDGYKVQSHDEYGSAGAASIPLLATTKTCSRYSLLARHTFIQKPAPRPLCLLALLSNRLTESWSRETTLEKKSKGVTRDQRMPGRSHLSPFKVLGMIGTYTQDRAVPPGSSAA